MKRREFITLVGGAAAAWPLAARAQQGERMRRIGVLMTTSADDPEGQSRIAAFHQGLQQWGWTVGGNVTVDIRFGVDNSVIRKHAGELAALAPDVILGNSSAAVGALLQVTRTVPIVFAVVADPVGAGFVEGLARPGGNATGVFPVSSAERSGTPRIMAWTYRRSCSRSYQNIALEIMSLKYAESLPVLPGGRLL